MSIYLEVKGKAFSNKVQKILHAIEPHHTTDEVIQLFKPHAENVRELFTDDWVLDGGPAGILGEISQYELHEEENFILHSITFDGMASGTGREFELQEWFHLLMVELESPPKAPVSKPVKKMTALVIAVYARNFERIKKLIHEGKDVNQFSKTRDGDRIVSPLIAAADEGVSVEIVKFLIENGADLDLPNNEGWTALMMAAHWGNLDRFRIAEVLVDNGADIDITNNKGLSALHISLEAETTNTSALLIKNGAKFDSESPRIRSGFMDAVRDHRVELVQQFLENGMDTRGCVDTHGRTPLMMKEDRRMVQLLIDHGEDVNARSNDGLTPLMHALSWGNPPKIEMLIDAGASVNNTDDQGDTILHWIAGKNIPRNSFGLKSRLKSIMCVLKTVPDMVHRKNNRDMTPLDVAVEEKNAAIAQFFERYDELCHTPNANLQENNFGNILENEIDLGTVFELSQQDATKLHFLIKKKAGINRKTYDGSTYLIKAAQADLSDLVKKLVDNGAEMNAQDRDGYTALAHAAENSNLEMVKYLLDMGADYTLCNTENKDPLNLSESRKIKEAIRACYLKGPTNQEKVPVTTQAPVTFYKYALCLCLKSRALLDPDEWIELVHTLRREAGLKYSQLFTHVFSDQASGDEGVENKKHLVMLIKGYGPYTGCGEFYFQFKKDEPFYLRMGKDLEASLAHPETPILSPDFLDSFLVSDKGIEIHFEAIPEAIETITRQGGQEFKNTKTFDALERLFTDVTGEKPEILVDYSDKILDADWSGNRRNKTSRSSGRATKRDVESISNLLKSCGSGLSAVKANKILLEKGILEVRERPSRSNPGQMKKFKALTEKGLEYGINRTNMKNASETSPYYYKDTFQALVDTFLKETL